MTAQALSIAGLTEVKAFIAGLQDELPKVQEKVQNGLAMEVWKAERAEMKDSFEGGPAPNTLSQIVYQKYGTRNLTQHEGAGVYIKDIFRTGSLAQESGPDRHYLSVMELGGKPAGPKRSQKRLQLAGILREGHTWAPARGAPLTKAGNISGARISDMLTSLGLGFVATEDKKYRLIYDEQQYPIGVAYRKTKNKWAPFMWFIREPTYGEGTFLWSLTGEIAVEKHFERIANYYLDKALGR